MDNAKWRKREDFIFFVGSAGIFMFSVYEILYQPDFMNDWPAHLHHVEQFWLEGTRDYSQHMHAHGPCTYPGGFMFLYTPLYLITGGSLQLFQLIWAALEIVMFFVVWEIVQSQNLPRLLGLLPVFSNRLHLYNVRVVINDFPSVLLMYICIYLVIKKRFTLASVLYSFVLSTKLNFVFFGPALALIYLKSLGFWPTFLQGVIMGIVQLAVGLPFLVANWRAYLTISYDLGRTLLWEKTRSFKFVGRAMYDARWFHLALLGIIIVLLLSFLWKVYKSKGNYERIAGHSLFFVNFLFVGFARGLYTPFMCWYFYSFPVVAYCSGIPLTYVTAFWALHEYLFRFFRDMEFEMYTTFVWLLINLLIIAKTMVNYPRASPEKGKKKRS
jgi:alpha-1,3-mannosyltransferase